MLEQALSALALAQRSNELIPDGMDPELVTKAVAQSIRDGGLSTSDFDALLETGFAAAGAAVCAATGIGVGLAPICAAAGSLVGGLIKGLFADDPPEPSAPDPFELRRLEQDAGYTYLTQRYEDTSAELLARVVDAQSADAIAGLLAAYFFPTPPNLGPQAWRDIVELAAAGTVPTFAESTLGGGFALPFFDPDYVLQGALLLKPGQPWIERYYRTISAKLEAAGVPFEAQANALITKAKDQGYRDVYADFVNREPAPLDVTALVWAGNAQEYNWRPYSDATAATLLAVQRDLRKRLWATLQAQMDLDLKRIIAAASVRAKLGMMDAIDELTDALIVETGCAAAACRAELRSIAAECAQELAAGRSVADVLAEIRPKAQRETDKPTHPTGTRAGVVVVGVLTAAGALAAGGAAWRVSKGKPAIPPAVSAGAARVGQGAARLGARVKRVFSR